MRDIELLPVPTVPADPAVDDAAYAKPSPAGILKTTTATDPARSDPNSYFKVSLGGEFGPARAALLSQPADGGVANLLAATTIIVTPPIVPTPPNAMPLGRSANSATVLNLYPWRKVPPQGLDMNNPYVSPAADDPPPEAPEALTPHPLAVAAEAKAKPASKAKKET